MQNELKTGIISTIGPSSWDQTVMDEMIANGMTVARVNGAFADAAEMQKVKELVAGRAELMIDIKGPEVRLNKFAEEMKVSAGDEIVIGSDANEKLFTANYPDTYSKLSVGQKILVGDGDLVLEVIKTDLSAKNFTVVVRSGHVLKPGKALNFPGFDIQDLPLSENDLLLIAAAKEQGWTSVSASFIRSASDAKAVREVAGNLKLVSKIEDRDGIKNIVEILPETDEVMIARGGLGVDLGLESVGISQYQIAHACKKAGVPFIVATQMVESMGEVPHPTRAEANDVVTAVLQGTSYVMLSAESTIGKYPVEAVKFLASTCALVEQNIQNGEIQPYF